MGKEIEKRFFKFDKREVVEKLKALNAKHKGEHVFKVWKFDIPSHMASDIHTLRVRDEGHKRTFTIKKRGKHDKYDTEFEVKIQDPQEMLKMLELMNFKLDHYYEKVRDIYKVGTSEVIFDIYPGMPLSMEIESKNVSILKKLMKKLGVKDDEEDKKVDDAFYQKYKIGGNFDSRIQKIQGGYTFKNVFNQSSHLSKENKKEYKSYVKKQLRDYVSLMKEKENSSN